MEAVVRLTTNPGLVSLFTEPVKRKQGEKEKKIEIPRRLTWEEREREIKDEESSNDRPSKRARSEEKRAAKTQALEDQRQKLREAMDKTREKLRKSKEKEEKEEKKSKKKEKKSKEERRAEKKAEKKAEKEKEKQVRKIFGLFTDDVDDFVEVKIKEKIKRFLNLNLFTTGCIQEEKEWKVKCKELRKLDQSLQVLTNQLISFYQEVSKKQTKEKTKFLLSLLSIIYLFYRLTFFFYSDLRMTKCAEDQWIQSASFYPKAVINKVYFIYIT